MKTIKILSLALLVTFFQSCNDDDSGPVNEEELITTVRLNLMPAGGGTAVTMTYTDLDGDGPTAPIVIVSDNLTANTTYNGSITLLNESVSPAENISEEVAEEALDHQFFYNATNGIGTFSYVAPFDSNGNPVGLNFTFTTTTPTAGVITVVLRHEPNKDAAGVSTGEIANAGGETDIQVTFPVTVE